METMRQAIAVGRFAEFEAEFHATRAKGDIDPL
jgi:queuine tRNA-ribosyltransferase